MKARIKSVEKLDDTTKLVFDGELPFTETFYDEEEYKKFRSKVLALIEIKQLNQLIGLQFDWELVSGNPFPVKLILLDNPIKVDFREPNSIFEALLPLSARGNFDSDYSFNGYESIAIQIERKEADDLISSILSGHLAEQIRKLTGSIKILLIEDFLTATSQMKVRTKHGVRNISWNAIWNYLQTAQREAGILLDFSPNSHITPKRIKSLYNYYQQPEHRSLRGVMLPSSSIESPMRTLMTFEGYSEQTARKVLEKFGTLRNYFEATEEERKTIPDIGPVKAKVINKVLDMPLKKLK